MELLDKIIQLQGTLVAIIALLQMLINFFLPARKAKKYNFLGRALDAIASTKGGFSIRRDNDS